MKSQILPLRTIQFWVRYNPKKRRVEQCAKFKYQLPKVRGHLIVQVKGTYFAHHVGDQHARPGK